MDSEEESPKKGGACRRALQDCSNMHPRRRSFIVKEDVSNFSFNRLPVYMQKELQLNKASSVNIYEPNKKGIAKYKKRSNTKSHINRPENFKSNSVLYAGALGDITTDNVYEIDAYDDNELGCSAGIPPSEKVLKKLGKIKKTKRTRKLKSTRGT